MKITKNTVAALTYQLEVEGKIVETKGENNPLEYIHGAHMLIPPFEAAVEGKEAGDEFTLSVPPAEAYGEYDPTMKFDIPKTSFMVDGVLREDLLVEGNIIPMFNGAGNVVHGTIAAINGDKVTMDFNPPMAGKTLNFTGKVLSVREATEKELTEGLHGEFLPREGCCGHHGGGCCHKHHGEGHEEGHCCGGHHEGEEGHCCGGHHDGEEGHCCHHHEGEGHDCCHNK